MRHISKLAASAALAAGLLVAPVAASSADAATPKVKVYRVCKVVTVQGHTKLWCIPRIVVVWNPIQPQ